jgi:hypothetical protein
MIKQIFVGFLLFWFLLYPAHSTFAISGNDWNKFEVDQQDGYIVGVIDSYKLMPAVCKMIPDANCIFARAVSLPMYCFPTSPYGQLIAIVRKFMEDSPEKWHFNMSENVHSALDRACNAQKPK